MLFNSYEFVLFFLPFFLIIFYILACRQMISVLLSFIVISSFFFYAYYNPFYILVLAGSILMNFILYRGIRKNKCSKLLFRVGIAGNLLILFCFKYLVFCVANLNGLFHWEIGIVEIAMPLGISFYTFQQISFLTDCYKGEIQEYSFLEYALYVSFFPQLIAGPIVLHTELIPQIKSAKRLRLQYDNLALGLYGFSIGLAKKVLIADTLSKIVGEGFGNVMELTSCEAIVVMLSYSLQIYFDFSAYSDMAIGIAKMININLPWNFNSPYKARSIKEFWDRWHMTLTRFLTTHVYFPLGGSRAGTMKTYRNIMIVFLVSGIWHGANWTFVVWGLLHGACMVAYRATRRWYDILPVWIRRGVTFVLVNVLWVLFRADNLTVACQFLTRLFAGGGIRGESVFVSFNKLEECAILMRLDRTGLLLRYPWIVGVLFIVMCMWICMYARNVRERMENFRIGVKSLLLTAVLLIYSIVSLAGVSEFIYFNF